MLIRCTLSIYKTNPLIAVCVYVQEIHPRGDQLSTGATVLRISQGQKEM